MRIWIRSSRFELSIFDYNLTRIRTRIQRRELESTNDRFNVEAAIFRYESGPERPGIGRGSRPL